MPKTNKDDYLATSFQVVDQTSGDKIIRCLDFMQSLECFAYYKERSIKLLQGRDNIEALDVACGLGDDVHRMRRLFGKVVGVDLSSQLIAEAIRRNKSDECKFITVDAAALPFPDNRFDAVRIDRSLQHIEDPIRVVKEMFRVLKPGGRILCAEPDWGTFFIGTGYTLETEMVQKCWSSSFKNPWIGRNLPELFKNAGVNKPVIEAHLLYTQNFEASDLVFDIVKSVEKVKKDCVVDSSMDGWLKNFKTIEGLAGVTLFICHGRKE